MTDPTAIELLREVRHDLAVSCECDEQTMPRCLHCRASVVIDRLLTRTPSESDELLGRLEKLLLRTGDTVATEYSGEASKFAVWLECPGIQHYALDLPSALRELLRATPDEKNE